ncbi:MAG: hypothetical protein AAF558_04125, partial [Verrucomicrobiota bacterium]
MDIPDSQISWPDYIVIAGYFILMIGVGIAFKGFNKNTDDYFRMGCQGSWWMVGASAFMVGFSSWTFTGAAGVAFESGLSVVAIYLANIIGFFIHFLFLAPWFRQLRVVTFPEVLSLRFDEKTRQIYAFVGVLLFSLFGGLQLYGLAIFSSAIFGFDLKMVILVLGCIVVVYSVSGGSWAVRATDFLQAVILMPLTILLAVLALQQLGGISGLFEKIEGHGLAAEYRIIKPGIGEMVGAYTLGWFGANVMTGVMKNCSFMGAQRYFSVKDGAEAKKAALFACVLFCLGPLIWFLPPVASRLVFETQVLAVAIPKPAEASYAIFSLNILPEGMIGLMVVAIFAASMSSLDSGLNGNSAIIIRDIFPAICKKCRWKLPSESNLLKGSRILSLVLGCFIVSMALLFSNRPGKGLFESMLDMIALLSTPLMLPMFMGLFIKHAPSWSALFSVGVTLCFSTACYFSETLFGSALNFQTIVAVNTTAGIISFLSTVPFWKNENASDKLRIQEFFVRMKTPVNYEKEVGVDNSLSQLLIMGA